MTTIKYKSMDSVPAELKVQLDRYFSNLEGDTFLVDNLPPQMTGALLARYSRVDYSTRLTLVNEFLDDQGNFNIQHANKLVDRVLNAFGDDSVRELEKGIIVGIEGASNLLTKEIEDRRIGGSPIEQSSRYVKYDRKDTEGKWSYLRPAEVSKAGIMSEFERVNDRAFEIYSATIPPLMDHFKEQFPKNKYKIKVIRENEEKELLESELESDQERKEFNTAYGFTIRCAALDVARGILPTSTKTQLGLSGNARFYTNLITHLKSSELEEAKERGYKLEAELQKVIPDFIKRNAEDPKIRIRNRKMYGLAQEILGNSSELQDKQVRLVTADNYPLELISNMLYPFTNIPLERILHILKVESPETQRRIIKTYCGERTSRRDKTGRASEAGYPFTFDIIGTFAEYRDLERHRMLTQQRQMLGTQLGFVMPEEIKKLGFEEKINGLLDEMDNLNNKMRKIGLETASQYATLFNHQVRFSMGMNLRELQHLTELRSQKAGHFGYRKIAMDMATEAIAREPLIQELLGFVDYSDPENKIARAKEQANIAKKNISKGIEGELE